MKRLVWIALLLLPVSCPFALANDPSPESFAPQKQLSNGLVQLTVLLPDAEKACPVGFVGRENQLGVTSAPLCRRAKGGFDQTAVWV